jgi:predicted ATPase
VVGLGYVDLRGSTASGAADHDPCRHRHGRRRRGGILAAIGDLGQVLVELLPTLAVIIGPQPALPELTGFEAQNRLNLACRRFFRAAATRYKGVTI